MELMMEIWRCTVHFLHEVVKRLIAENIERLDGHLRKFYNRMNVQLILTSKNRLGQDSLNWLWVDTVQRTTLQACHPPWRSWATWTDDEGPTPFQILRQINQNAAGLMRRQPSWSAFARTRTHARVSGDSRRSRRSANLRITYIYVLTVTVAKAELGQL